MSTLSTLAESATPLVTVITPAYNVAGYVGEAVDSVLRQTFRDFEYLLVDDGSADKTAEVAQAHSAGDPRFRVIRRVNGGVGAARNTGLKEARGTYIAFLDGDDRWHRRFLERQLSLIESLPEDVGLVFCRSRIVLENGTPVFIQWQRAGRYDFDDFLINVNPARNGGSLLIRKSCFDEVGFFDESLPVEDLEMWLRIADQSTTPVLWGSRHCLMDVRLRPGQATRNREVLDTALLEMFDWQVPKLRRSPAGLPYVRPAAYAHKYGLGGKTTDELLAKARTVPARELMRSPSGWRFLFWDKLPDPGRSLLRGAQHNTREAVKAASHRLRAGAGR